jgi:hypothetical protein
VDFAKQWVGQHPVDRREAAGSSLAFAVYFLHADILSRRETQDTWKRDLHRCRSLSLVDVVWAASYWLRTCTVIVGSATVAVTVGRMLVAVAVEIAVAVLVTVEMGVAVGGVSIRVS